MRRSLRNALIAAAAVPLAALTLAPAAPPSDHLDSPYIDELPARDIGDLFVWNGAQTGSPAFLINLRPLTAPSTAGIAGLDPDVLYEFKIDLDGDYVADEAYKIQAVGEVNGPDETQEIVLYHATGDAAAANTVGGTVVARGRSTAFGDPTPDVVEGAGGALLFVGARQDPFFFDFKDVYAPVADDLRFALSSDGLPTDGTSANTFGPTNIVAVAIEVPALRGKRMNTWATTSVDGVQQDRCGKSSLTAIFLPGVPAGRNPDHYPFGGLKQTFNDDDPAGDSLKYNSAFRHRLYQVQVDKEHHDELVSFYLPDVLRFDPSAPQAYPNGRNLKEDAVFWTIRHINPFLAAPDSLGLPKTSPQPMLDVFPYAAPPLTSDSTRVGPTSDASGGAARGCAWWHLFCHLARLF